MTERRISESHGCELKRRVQYERGRNESPSIAAATALAEYYDEDASATTRQLYDYVDPDALDALFADTHAGRSRASGTVEFTVEGVTVTVTPDRVEVVPET